MYQSILAHLFKKNINQCRCYNVLRTYMNVYNMKALKKKLQLPYIVFYTNCKIRKSIQANLDLVILDLVIIFNHQNRGFSYHFILMKSFILMIPILEKFVTIQTA